MENVLKQLDNRHFFTRNLFRWKFNGEDGCLVQITYRDLPDAEIQVLQPKSPANPNETQWCTVESPSRYTTVAEKYQHTNLDNALHAVYGWSDRIAELTFIRMRAAPNASDRQEILHRIEEGIDAMPDGEKPFSPDEADDIMVKVNALAERLGAVEKETDQQRATIDQLKRELEQYRRHATTIPRKSFMKSVVGKLADIATAAGKAGATSLGKGGADSLIEWVKGLGN